MEGKPARLPGVGEKFIAGDPLRAICALLVVTFHVGLMVSGWQRARGVPGSFEEHFGTIPGSVLTAFLLSVYVFLSLSGYLVGRPFLRAYVLGRKQPPIRPYARNRVVRIMPLFLVTWTLTWILRNDQIQSWRDVVEPYLFLQIYRPTELSDRMIHAWTVDVEVVFYILLPIVVTLLVKLSPRMSAWGRAWLFLVPLAIFSVLSLLLRVDTNGTPEYFQPHTLVFAFAPGLALATLEPLVAPKLRARGSATGMLRVGVAILVVSSVVTALLPIDHDWLHTFAGIAGAMFITVPLVRQWAGQGASKLMDNRALHWIGERSYSIYMLHVLVRDELGVIPENIESAWVGLVLTLGALWLIMIPVSALSYRFIEMPFLKLKEYRGSFTGGSPPTDAIPGAGTPKAARQAGEMAP